MIEKYRVGTVLVYLYFEVYLYYMVHLNNFIFPIDTIGNIKLLKISFKVL